jgi:hypothetical protein
MRLISRARPDTNRSDGARGQSLVEYAMAVPVFMLMLLGMLEFGFAFSHHLGLEYATREGARMGAALGPGDGPDAVPCAEVDNQIIAAVQRVLDSPGTAVNMAAVQEIRIYLADASGNENPSVRNVWKPGAGPTVDGVALFFAEDTSNWDACGRDNGSTPDSIGVAITYTYAYVTPVGNFMGLGGSPTLLINDKTVMALNPGF